MTKIMSAYKTIGEVAQEVGLVDERKKKINIDLDDEIIDKTLMK